MSLFAEFEKTNAEEFVEILRPSNPFWQSKQNTWNNRWYFRGQSDAKLPLLPSAWRKSKRKKQPNQVDIIKNYYRDSGFKRMIDTGLRRKWDSLQINPDDNPVQWVRSQEILWQAFCEHVLITEFIQLSDSLGHRSSSSQLYFGSNKTFINDYIDLFYDQKDVSSVWSNGAVALAQHHGVPTRLLDWTRNPRIAAYFAASSAINSGSKDGHIAVYALDGPTFEGMSHIKIIRLPLSEDSFLLAQDGLFTYDTLGDSFYLRTGKFLDFETSFNTSRNLIIGDIKPRKLTLPVSEAKELMRLLWLEGISQAHLMPTLDNIALALKFKWSLAIPNWEN